MKITTNTKGLDWAERLGFKSDHGHGLLPKSITADPSTVGNKLGVVARFDVDDFSMNLDRVRTLASIPGFELIATVNETIEVHYDLPLFYIADLIEETVHEAA